MCEIVKHVTDKRTCPVASLDMSEMNAASAGGTLQTPDVELRYLAASVLMYSGVICITDRHTQVQISVTRLAFVQ